MQSELKLQSLNKNLSYKEARRRKLLKKNFKELLRLHPDFDTLKNDEKFLSWLDEQPESISDGIYKNNTDAKWASRVISLYKADTGTPKKAKKVKNLKMLRWL